MSSRVGRLLSDGSAEIQATLKQTNSNARNTTTNQQVQFVTSAMIDMIGQEIGLAPRTERHVYMDMKTEMEDALAAGTFDTQFPHLTQLRDSLHKKYFAGINIANVEQLKFDMDERKKRATRRNEVSRRLQADQWIETDEETGRHIWMAGTPREARDGRKKMMENAATWAYLEGEFGDVKDAKTLMQKIKDQQDAVDQQDVIQGMRQSNNLVLQGIGVSTGTNAPVARPAGGAQNTSTPATNTGNTNQAALDSLKANALAPLKPGETIESRTTRVNGMIELLAGQTGMTTDELEASIGLAPPKG
jgi:hypothetical protein